MNKSIKFDPKKLEKLNNPDRIKYLNPDLIWETLNLKNPQALVDIGAGTGFFASLFCKKMNGGKVYACDTSEVMIGWMKENLRNEDNCALVPVKSEENSIPLPSGIADLVYLFNIFHELENRDKLLSECYRLLKKNGKIAVIDWKPEPTPQGPPLEIRIPENTVKEALKGAGFSNLESHNLPYHYFVIGIKVL